MRTIELIALAATGVLALIGLWTVSMTWRVLARLRSRTQEINKEKL